MNPGIFPTVFVIFGATGDLMSKKIVPALYHLYTSGKLPPMVHVIGFSRREWTTDEFRVHIRTILAAHAIPSGSAEDFVMLFHYQKGDFHNREYFTALATQLGRVDDSWNACSNKLFYLAVPPQSYEQIFHNLAESGLTVPCGPDGGWTRVLVEKPFGKDAATAERLDLLMAKLFTEEQIYRIDHYLAKEMLQNILAFRFSNNLLESSWNSAYIEKIHITFYEQGGVDGRGEFYDGIGALRDVGQNHMLQMLALATMDRPRSFDTKDVRTQRAAILRTLIPYTQDEVPNYTIRGQYDGYRGIEGVDTNSNTETFFRIVARLDDPRWAGVPIYLESGKKTGEQRKEMKITFRHANPCLCSPDDEHMQNEVTFTIEPEERIQIDFVSKKPGLGFEVEKKQFEFPYVRENSSATVDYERLLYDCITGNQLLFVSTEEIAAMWRFIDPILEAWQHNTVPLMTYSDGDSISRLQQHILGTSQRQEISSKSVGIVGLGKMGGNIARQLVSKGWQVVGYNRTYAVTQGYADDGIIPAKTLAEMVALLPSPRILWVMVPAGKAVDEVLFGQGGLSELLQPGDIVIDAGNSFYKDAQRREKLLAKFSIRFIDIGVSGGPGGALRGACLMVGGDRGMFEYLQPLLRSISVPGGVVFCEGVGAGHFVKMVHNGIEYGMMQSIAEGFALMKESPYKLDLTRIAEVYNHGSVIESKLVLWLYDAFREYGEELLAVSSTVAHSGEGQWTVEAGKEYHVPVESIELALEFRKQSAIRPSYIGKIVSALRNQFGGHSVT